MNPVYRPSWQRRWLVVRLTLAFCAGVIVYTVGFGPDDKVRETALYASFGLAMTVVTGYLGFASWDDKNVMRHCLRRRSDKSDSSEEDASN